jgi:hypothetical protein
MQRRLVRTCFVLMGKTGFCAVGGGPILEFAASSARDIRLLTRSTTETSQTLKEAGGGSGRRMASAMSPSITACNAVGEIAM